MVGRTRLELRFWLEAGIAIAAIALLILTAIWRDWIEIFFEIDADNGSGALELAIVLGLSTISVVNMLLAGRDWRGPRQRAADHR